MTRIEWHLLDDAQLVSVLDAEPQQFDGVVQTRDRIEHRIHLDRIEPGGLGGRKAGKHIAQPVAAGDVGEPSGVDRVQRYVDPVQPGVLQLLRALREPNSVGGQGNFGAGSQ